MSHHRLPLLAVVAALLLLPTAARSATLFLNPSAFDAGATLLTFEDPQVAANVAYTSYGGVGFRLLTLGTNTATAFGPTGAGAPHSTSPREFAPIDGPNTLNTINVAALQFAFDYDLRITLPSLVRAVGLEIRSGQTGNDSDDLLFELYAGSTARGSVTTAVRGLNRFFFYGIANDVAFDTLVIRQRPDSRFEFDNLRYGNLATARVPEPGTLALLAGALGLVAVVRRRRTAAR